MRPPPNALTFTYFLQRTPASRHRETSFRRLAATKTKSPLPRLSVPVSDKALRHQRIIGPALFRFSHSSSRGKSTKRTAGRSTIFRSLVRGYTREQGDESVGKPPHSRGGMRTDASAHTAFRFALRGTTRLHFGSPVFRSGVRWGSKELASRPRERMRSEFGGLK